MTVPCRQLIGGGEDSFVNLDLAHLATTSPAAALTILYRPAVRDASPRSSLHDQTHRLSAQVYISVLRYIRSEAQQDRRPDLGRPIY